MDESEYPGAVTQLSKMFQDNIMHAFDCQDQYRRCCNGGESRRADTYVHWSELRTLLHASKYTEGPLQKITLNAIAVPITEWQKEAKVNASAKLPRADIPSIPSSL